MEVLGVAANVIAVVDLSAKLGSLCVQYGREVKNAPTDIERLHKEIASLQAGARAVQDLLNGPDGDKLDRSQLKADLDECLLLLKKLELKLTPPTARKVMGRIGIRALKWPFQSKDVNGLILKLRQHADAIHRILQVGQTSTLLQVHRTILNNDQTATLARLPIAEGACYDSSAEQHNSTCLPNTRVDLLQKIEDWSVDPNAKPIFWLNGMAGTGKSTISRSIARDFAASGRLGASFFFKRGEADRSSLSKFFTTIATQLIQIEPSMARPIKDALDADPFILSKASRDQFDKFIVQPLVSIPTASRFKTLVVVVDALDECDKDDDIRLLISILSEKNDLPSLKLKIFVTSRPELPIRLGFNAAAGAYQDLVLHEVQSDIIGHDLTAFFQHELADIKDNFNSKRTQDQQLPEDWPGNDKIPLLVKMAIPLFIFAATVCRSLADRRMGHPNQQLRKVLEFQGQSYKTQLSATYRPILDRLIDGLDSEQQEILITNFQIIVGSIVLLGNPLSISALSQLLAIEREEVDAQLDLLHSVLSIPTSSDSPIRIFHLSFHDFLVDVKHHGHPFWIDKKEVHNRLAIQCLYIMNKNLDMDICKLSEPGIERVSVSPQVISSHIQAETQYACLYWAYHRRESGLYIEDNGPVHTFLKDHFLHWLEALALIGRATNSLGIIDELEALCEEKSSQILKPFLQDAQRFIRMNIAIINTAPLQIYSSVLALTPKESIIRMAFYQIPGWISHISEPEKIWDLVEQILEGHDDQIKQVASSPDGTLIASASDDKTIRLWRVSDGTCVQELSHGDWVRSVAFSPDGTLIASASDDQKVRFWRISDGICIQELNCHGDSLESVAFSPDGMLLASASNNIIQLWRISNSTCIQELRGHSDWARSAAFSPDGTLIASTSDDKTVRLWRVDDGVCIQKLEGHSDCVRSAAFSPDGTLIVSASGDETVRLWQVSDGTCIQELRGHSNWVVSVAFSPDGTLVVSASGDETVRLWRVSNGICIQELKGHSDWVGSVAFLPNGTLIASASDDKTVRLWRVSDSTCIQEPKSYSSWIRSVAFSPDGMLIASASDDQKVRLWRSDGTCIQELKGHSASVIFVTFSPDGLNIASASDDKTIRLWRVSDSTCIQEFRGHSKWIRSVAFSPDGMLIASASGDQKVRLWRSDGTCIQELKGHSASVIFVTFSPDGMHIASASDDKTVRLWRVDDGVCIQEILDTPTKSIQFHSNGSWLCTDYGTIHKLDIPLSNSLSCQIPPSKNYIKGIGISQDRCWVVWKSKKVFWIPQQFRPTCMAVSGSIVAFGCALGKVIIIGFVEDTPPVSKIP